jgi:hypothetical protein
MTRGGGFGANPAAYSATFRSASPECGHDRDAGCPPERQGVRSLDVMCTKCRHETNVNVDRYSDHMTVPSFGPRMVCTRCGHSGADVRPNWVEYEPKTNRINDR